ncbi:MAG: TadE/TadG family type IV pilus assembly protein [Acidobacteriaceae bacterium]
MRSSGHKREFRQDGGQSLLETAIFLPILILLVAYAVDFGYFFIVAANLTSASRSAAEYSIQGFASPAQSALPTAGPITTYTSVAALAVGDLSSLAASSTTTTVQVCSKSVGINSNVTKCASYGPAGTAYTPAADPEAPSFFLNRVDVTYTVQPPIPLSFFSYSLLPTMNFHRQVSMRVLD